MKALTKDRCSDPYGEGCKDTATGSMRGRRYDSATGAWIETTIYTCRYCSWWNCDWDWDSEPEGPFLRGVHT